MTKTEQLPFDLGPRHAHEREDFWVSDSNRAAIAWLDRWAGANAPEMSGWPAPVLVIYGPLACGKSHLCSVWQKKSHAVMMDSVEKMQDWRGGPVSVVCDNALRFIGDRKNEEYLFHLYNSMQGKGVHILMTAEKPVAEWPFVLPDLKSRLMAAPAVEVGSPDDMLMAVVLTKLFSDRQIFVPQEVVQFIVSRIERSFLAMRQIVDKIDRRALSEKRPVTIPLVRELL